MNYLNFLKNALENILGKDNVEVMEDPVMGSEDFAYFGNIFHHFSSLLELMMSN